MTNGNEYEKRTTAWCPGCGNFAILDSVKESLEAMNKKPREVLLIGGIGQASKLPQYLSANSLCTLHGRALPAATGAKIGNTSLTVVAFCGDGDCYGEGGNHFIHAIRRNIDITVLVHNNQVYGLTQGQASPSSDMGFTTKVQPQGVRSTPLSGPALAVALGCGFVARGFAGNKAQLISLIQEGIRHRGFSLIEVIQPCPSMNRHNTFGWYKERIRDLQSEWKHDSSNRTAAFERALLWGETIPVGIFYRSEEGRTFESRIPILNNGPLVKRPLRRREVTEKLIEAFI
ncbi:MAG: 2-oxoacid ferredoxin oxidoreductase [Deltaproteobacteria bacterium]|nr:2-oxoacid ferredoxin oxidoreductase [Deltaproteobacteria bacterium]